ncbi:MAG TPA: hypothetical protein VJV96_21005 [Candidatus Angelobacter sp.]|jgi:hypothetical protein|nr:hypothetical protein [Candidatus Angelobacter sp.]
MPQLVMLVKWEVLIFLVGLAALVVLQLLTGQISTDGLFRDTGPKGSGQMSSARVQLLITTLGAAAYYLSQVATNPNPGTFPPIPTAWPVILGGSNLLHLGTKAFTAWFGQQKTN